jgi:ankyrin repeat protein
MSTVEQDLEEEEISEKLKGFIKKKDDSKHESIRKKELGTIKKLKQKPFFMRILNHPTYLFLHYAVKQNNNYAVKHLIQDLGADVNQIDPGRDDNTPYGSKWTPLHVASKKGFADIIKTLIENRANIESMTTSGFTPLIIASYSEHVDAIKMLLEKGAMVDNNGVNGKTALMYASKKGHIKVIGILIDKGANINAQDSQGETALMMAIQKNQINTWKVLIGTWEADINIESYEGTTALLEAMKINNDDLIMLLLSKGADVNVTEIDRRDVIRSPLLWAVQNKKVDIVTKILESIYIENLNVIDVYGNDALYYARRSNNTEIQELLESKLKELKKSKGGRTKKKPIKKKNKTRRKKRTPSYYI